MVLKLTAGAVRVEVKVKVKRQGKGRANSCKIFSHQHCMVLFAPLQVVALKTEFADLKVYICLCHKQACKLAIGQAASFCGSLSRTQVNTEYRC